MPAGMLESFDRARLRISVFWMMTGASTADTGRRTTTWLFFALDPASDYVAGFQFDLCSRVTFGDDLPGEQDRTERMSENDCIGFVLQDKMPREQVPISVLRADQRIDLQLPLQ